MVYTKVASSRGECAAEVPLASRRSCQVPVVRGLLQQGPVGLGTFPGDMGVTTFFFLKVATRALTLEQMSVLQWMSYKKLV